MAKKTHAKKGKGADSGVSPHYQKALDGLERAMKALYKGDPERAKEQLLKLADGYADEYELMDRVKLYLSICDRQMAPQKRPKDAEEMVTAGVMAMNEGEDQQAIKMFTKALDSDPKNVQAAYCLAAAHARAGDASATAKHLRQAISADPTNRIHAKADQDFAGVRDEQEVAALLDA